MSFKLQQQIKQNAEDIRRYVTDLYDWEEEVDSKKATNKNKPQTKKPEVPIRGKTDISIQRDEEEDNNLSEKEKLLKKQKNKNLVRDSNTVQDYYKAWDKFDVDEELNELEDEEKKEKQKKLDQMNPYLQDPNQKEKAPPRSKIQIKGGRGPLNTINSLRDRGNLHFKSSDYNLAIDQYTECIKLFQQHKITRDEQEIYVAIYSNRAMAYLKLQEYSKAESDCNQALQLNPEHSKSLYRRGVSRKKMKKFRESLEDFEKAASFDKSNQEIQREMQYVKQKYSTMREEANKKLVLPFKEESYQVKVEVQDVETDLFDDDNYIDDLEEQELERIQQNQEIYEDNGSSQCDEEDDEDDDEQYEKGKLSSSNDEDNAEDEDENIKPSGFGNLRRDSDIFQVKQQKLLKKKSTDDDEEEDHSKFSHLKNIDSYHKHKKESIPSMKQQLDHEVYFRNEKEVISDADQKSPHPHYDPDEVPKRGIFKSHEHDQYVQLKDIDGKVIKNHSTENLELKKSNTPMGKDNDIKFGGEEVIEIEEDITDVNCEKHAQHHNKKPRRSILNSESIQNYQKVLQEEEEEQILFKSQQGFKGLQDVEGKIIKHHEQQDLDEKEEQTRQKSISFGNTQYVEGEDDVLANEYRSEKTPRKSILRNDITDQLTFLQGEDNFNSEKIKNLDGKLLKHSQKESKIEQQVESPMRNRQMSIKFKEDKNQQEVQEHQYSKNLQPRRSILKQVGEDFQEIYDQNKEQRQKSKTEFKKNSPKKNNDGNFEYNSEEDNDDNRSIDTVSDADSDYINKHVTFSSAGGSSKNIKFNMQEKDVKYRNSVHHTKSILKPKGSYEKNRSKSMRVESTNFKDFKDLKKNQSSPPKKLNNNNNNSKNNSANMGTIKEDNDDKKRCSDDNIHSQKQLNQQQSNNIQQQSQQQQQQFNHNTKNSVQFMQKWANLKKNTSKQFEFLSNEVDPTKLKEIFKQGMDVSLIQDIFNCLKDNFENNQNISLAFIEHVPKVKRFEINRMSMIQKEKQSISEILQNLKKNNLISEDDHKQYTKSYQI